MSRSRTLHYAAVCAGWHPEWSSGKNFLKKSILEWGFINETKNTREKSCFHYGGSGAVVDDIALAVFAAVQEEVYNDPETGISVSVDESSDALLPKAVTFQVVVNGEQVAEKTVEGLPATDAEITVKADGYDVFVEGSRVSVVESGDRYRLTYFGSDSSYTAVINIATEKVKDNIAVTDGTTAFGTFSWSKVNADTSAFTRQVTIRVNGEEKWTQRVNTPKDLTNTMHTSQYWFTPNTAMFKSAVTLSPAKVLDQLSNRDLTIDLTTVCGCGGDTCLCAGGCDCPVDCTCEDCMGTNLGDTQINTGFGLLEYKNPTGSGYNLTVDRKGEAFPANGWNL